LNFCDTGRLEDNMIQAQKDYTKYKNQYISQEKCHATS